MKATLKQGKKVLGLIENIPSEQIQELLASGLLSDLLKANIAEINRQEFRKLSGLVPIKTKEFKITAAKFDLVAFIGGGWEIVLEKQDEKSLALSEIDFANVRSVSCLDKDETSIKGKEKLRRLIKESNDIRLGATVFMGLWNDYQANRENSVLECLYKEEIIGGYIDFFGTILLPPHGDRRVLCLCRRVDGRWRWSIPWLGCDWRSRHLSLVLPQVS